MSVLQTWFTRSIATPRSRYGYTRCSGADRLVPGWGTSAHRPSVRSSRRTRLGLTAYPSRRSTAVIRRTP